MIYVIIVASLFLTIHLMTILICLVKKDANINNNVTVIHGGRRIGGQNDSVSLLRDYGDGADTYVGNCTGARPNVTTDFKGVYVRLYDMITGQYYDAYMEKLIQIGRTGSGCDIEINDIMVSSKHCAIYRKGNDILIHDLGSKNHTFVNDYMLEYPIPLTFGDVIRLGEHTFQFQFFDVNQ